MASSNFSSRIHTNYQPEFEALIASWLGNEAGRPSVDAELPPAPIVSAIEALVPSNKVAFIERDCCWTYEELASEVDCLASGMARFGVLAGDRVCLHLQNGPEAAIAYYACFRLGAVAVPMNLRHTSVELESTIRRVRPVLYLGHAEFYVGVARIDHSILAKVARFVVGDTDDTEARSWTALLGDPADAPTASRADREAPAVLLATSGTTGQSKLVAHSLGSLAHIAARGEYLGFQSGQVLALAMPMMHISGLTIFFAAMRLGIVTVFVQGIEPGAILDAVEKHRCSLFTGHPMMVAHMVECQQRQPRDVSSLQWCIAGGDVCPLGQQETFRSVFGLPLHSFWGSTEAITSLTYGLQTGAVSRLAPDTELRLVGLDGIEVSAGDIGEMLLRGPNVMLGYWSGPGFVEGKQDAWYRTGDLMRQDDEGNIWFVSHLNDLIVRGGSNISPVEVEQVLSRHPAVREAAVIGVPDPILGQKVIGFVRLHDGTDALQLAAILDCASVQLAAYKLPERLLAVAELPRNSLGKVDRKRLAAQITPSLNAA